MPRRTSSRRLSVCVLSAHPLVLGEFTRLLAACRVLPRLVDPAAQPAAAPRFPRARVFVVDAAVPRAFLRAVLDELRTAAPAARIVVVALKFSEAEAFALLRLGVRGLLTYSADKKQVLVTHACYGKGIEQVPEKVDISYLYPWANEKLLSGQFVHFSSLAELPPEAVVDRHTWEATGVKSNINIPIQIRGSVEYLIAGQDTLSHRRGQEALLLRLRLVGEIFANALIRCKALVDGSLGTHFAGNIMMGFGLLSLLTAAFSMLRQKDIKRLFAYSSIEHMGIATFAFGLGGPIATFGGVLHMIVHSLAKSATFFSVGHAAQMHGTQEMARIRGLIRGNPAVGWGMFLGVMALAGMPPFGIFTSEFLILTATMKDAPYLAPLLLLGLTVAFAALFRKVQPMVAGLVPAGQKPLQAANIPVFLQLSLVLVMGIYLPSFLARWFQLAVEILK